MKLFKSLLVAPATLGLLAPIAATANEVTISDFTPAEQLAITNSRVDGLEARLNNFEAGSFSETTTASFSVDFGVGAVDGKGTGGGVTDGDETLQAAYGFQIDLSTSFTGEDSLDISLDAGNANGSLSEFDFNGPATVSGSNTASDALTVDGISYTFPLGSATAFVGDNTDGSMLFTTACAYGGPSNTLDDCANVTAGITGGGLAIGAAYDFDNGFTAAAGAQFVETGIATTGNADSWALNLAYTTDSYGASVTYAMVEDSGGKNDTFTALNGYYSFDNGLNISAGYEVGDLDGHAAANDETEAYFVGVNGEVGPGELGAAVGTYGKMTESSSVMPERMMYEVYYAYPVNDGMTITPLVYTVEAEDSNDSDETGIMVKTSFSF